MTYTSRIIEDHFRREGRPRDSEFDAYYGYQMAVLRDLLSRLDVILEDEGIERETAERVIRCLLYGAPSRADAEQRMRTEQEMIKLMNERPPAPIVLPRDVAERIGLPPR